MESVDIRRENTYKEKLRAEVVKRTKSYSCRIFLFGSRVSGPLRRSSDFDIGISGLSKEDFFRIKLKLDAFTLQFSSALNDFKSALAIDIDRFDSYTVYIQ